MTITAFEATKRGRISVYLDGEFACALHPDIFYAAGLKIGGELSREEIEELHSLSQQKITRERALRLLGQRSYTEAGLREKLAARADAESADLAVERMKELGLLDDADYARRYASDLINLKGFSHRRAAQELGTKGIGRELIEETLAAFEENPEQNLARIITRKYLRYLGDEKGIQKTVNALLRLGYRYDDIRRVIANLREDEGYYDETSSFPDN